MSCTFPGQSVTRACGYLPAYVEPCALISVRGALEITTSLVASRIRAYIPKYYTLLHIQTFPAQCIFHFCRRMRQGVHKWRSKPPRVTYVAILLPTHRFESLLDASFKYIDFVSTHCSLSPARIHNPTPIRPLSLIEADSRTTYSKQLRPELASALVHCHR
jgi:hypothetical protein